ncbi:30S ribosomal protein S9 [Candidatus Woesebacteria bacterium]|jgi:small subunit ribosomal protein S9|nr:30S ribosomal protein S9 [Candidatus Woesebacteria bacterium]
MAATAKIKTLKFYEAIGRRKSAIARVRLYLGTKGNKPTKKNVAVEKGEIMVNDLPIDKYFQLDMYKSLFDLPLVLTGAVGRFAISVLAQGGGKKSQMQAVQLGVSRALELVDAENRSKLKPEGLLSRDARVRERRKPGTGGRARRQKQSPKR